MSWEQLGPRRSPVVERGSRGAMVLGLVLLAAVVGAFVVMLNRSDWEEQSITAVRGATDSTTLAVTVAHGQCGNGGPRVHIDRQTSRLVELSADHDVSGDCDDIAMRTTVEVDLDEPLGQRTIEVALHRAEEGLECTIDGHPSDICT